LLDQPSILISRPEYALSWNPSTRIVNWASWVLVDGNVGKTNRSGFKRDEDLNKFLLAQGETAVGPDEYNDKHCFDRGHVVPSADRTEKFAQNQAVFKMSNMMPQTAFLNRVIWERLEGTTRSLLARNPKNRYWVVAGPIFTTKMRYMGVKKNIAIPDSNFKIVIDLGSSKSSVPKLIASVIMPNVTSKGTDPIDDETFECYEERNLPSVDVDWADYTVSIDEIEKAAGVDMSAVKAMLP
ncbi:MAG: DNA/RNA non-specific endonuclease, partial [Proteobacteria bacterium]